MSEKTYLSGKLICWTLPHFEDPRAATQLLLKRLALPQGELAQCYDSDDPIRYIAYIELKRDTVRGNHYHKAKEEFVYMIAGKMRLIAEDLDTREKIAIPLSSGALILIRPGAAHRMEISEPGHALEFSSQRYNPADTFRHVIEGEISQLN